MSEIEKDQVLAQLSRIVGSRDFTAGPRVKKFLTHLVTEELDGRGDALRGTALAMDVFARGVDFDPNTDPVVRIEAVKLRKALEHYYLASGAQDTLRIEVPKGQYRPVFSKVSLSSKSAPAGPVAPSVPSIGVAAFSGSDGELARLYRLGLPEEVALELSRFDHLRVFSGNEEEMGPSSDSDDNASALTCDYLLKGSVRDAGQRVRVTVQLTRQPDGLLVWSDRFDLSSGADDVFEVQEQIARQCATRLADAYGAVAEDIGAMYSGRDRQDAGVYEALLAFHAHMRTSRVNSLREFTDLANSACKDNPGSGLSHALVAIGYLEELTMGLANLEDVLAKGSRHAEKALSLSPQCQEALFAGAGFAQLQRDTNRFERLVNAAVTANPNGSLLIAIAGGWIAMFGQVEKGAELVSQAVADNPILPVWTNISLALSYAKAGQSQKASDKVKNVDARDSAGDWIIIGALHDLAGEHTLAKKARARAKTLGMDTDRFFSQFPLPTDIASLLSGASG